MKKVTDKHMALFFGLTPETVNRHKNSDDVKLNNRYKALKEFYIKASGKTNPALKEVAVKLSECSQLINSLDVNQGN
jgi:hypothetical protein